VAAWWSVSFTSKVIQKECGFAPYRHSHWCRGWVALNSFDIVERPDKTSLPTLLPLPNLANTPWLRPHEFPSHSYLKEFRRQITGKIKKVFEAGTGIASSQELKFNESNLLQNPSSTTKLQPVVEKSGLALVADENRIYLRHPWSNSDGWP
jgi:hypothetical protein